MTTKDLYTKYIIPSYTRSDLVIVKGRGSWVWDEDGKKYLDLFPGWGVNGLGHCHPAVVKSASIQLKKLIHVPNNFYNQPQAKLSYLLIENSFPGKCFFSNSGAEANECAIKLARKYGNSKGRYEIITMHGSFHGRTLATITATGQPKYKEGFEPLVPGFRHVPFNDINALKSAITPQTTAIMLEPIQGEGGINIAKKEYLKELSNICREKGILLILDEVQTGMARTGRFFAYENYDIQPDVITLAKSLGGGLAIGATIIRQEFADTLTAGTHASTFGGNPLASAVACSVIETIKKQNLLNRVNELGRYLHELLSIIAQTFPAIVKEVRGMGLMWGIELNIQGKQIVNECQNKGLLINCTQEKVIRLLPALTSSKKELALGIRILMEVLRNINIR